MRKNIFQEYGRTALIAGATATPNYIKSNPAKSSFFAPKVQKPEEVARECLKRLGSTPSLICGRGNRLASFFMHRLLPRKLAVKIWVITQHKSTPHLIYKRNNSVFNSLFVFAPEVAVFGGTTAVVVPFAGEEENNIV